MPSPACSSTRRGALRLLICAHRPSRASPGLRLAGDHLLHVEVAGLTVRRHCHQVFHEQTPTMSSDALAVDGRREKPCARAASAFFERAVTGRP